MKMILYRLIILLALCLTGCSVSGGTSAVVPVDLNDEVSISNGDFDLTIYQIMQIEAKQMADREIRLKDSVKEEVNLYEIQMRYINQTNEANKLSYQELWISTPEKDEEGYCTPRLHVHAPLYQGEKQAVPVCRC